jgi:hypothetical protein
MKLCFDSVDELRDFVKSHLKGTRGGKNTGDDGEGTTAGAGTTTAAPQPAVAALVARIVPKIDGAIASGQPTDQVLSWFRGQCGPEAAGATLDQIKTVFLPKMAAPGLENIAKLMAA